MKWVVSRYQWYQEWEVIMFSQNHIDLYQVPYYQLFIDLPLSVINKIISCNQMLTLNEVWYTHKSIVHLARVLPKVPLGLLLETCAKCYYTLYTNTEWKQISKHQFGVSVGIMLWQTVNWAGRLTLFHTLSTIPINCTLATAWDDVIWIISPTLAFVFKPNPINKNVAACVLCTDRQVLMKKAPLAPADHRRWIDMIRGGGSGEGGLIFTDFGPLGLISKFLLPGELHTPPIGPLY